MSTTALPYRLGATDTECRYPVLIGDHDDILGRVFRWHREWFAESSEGVHNCGRPEKGARGHDMAAAYLVEQYTAGEIRPLKSKDTDKKPNAFSGPVPLLHPRMPDSPRNRDAAHAAFAGLTHHRWTAHGGYPGSDNPWYVSCDLCPWEGPKYWSHLRGRNGNPPSPRRHQGGCIGEEQVRALIPAYQQ